MKPGTIKIKNKDGAIEIQTKASTEQILHSLVAYIHMAMDHQYKTEAKSCVNEDEFIQLALGNISKAVTEGVNAFLKKEFSNESSVIVLATPYALDIKEEIAEREELAKKSKKVLESKNGILESAEAILLDAISKRKTLEEELKELGIDVEDTDDTDGADGADNTDDTANDVGDTDDTGESLTDEDDKSNSQ